MTDKSLRLTPVYDLLLRGTPTMPVGLYHLHLATCEQLTRLHYRAGTRKTVGKRLKTLVDHGYLQADSLPTRRLKSPYSYSLATKGIRYLAGLGLDIPDRPRASKEADQHSLFVDHALELNDILIAALHLKLTDQPYYLARYLHERNLKRMPYRVSQGGETISLIPDGFLDIRQRRPGTTEVSLPLLLEHDQNTEQQWHFKQRIRAYRAFLQTAAYRQLFGIEGGVTVAFTTFQNPRRLALLRDWTRQELVGTPQLATMFLFADLPKPLEPRHLVFERCWFTLTGDQPIALLEN